MLKNQEERSLADLPLFELPATSKWQKPACNRVVKAFDSWALIEIWPTVIIKIDLSDLALVMRHRWNLKRGRKQGILIVNGSQIKGSRGQMTLQRFIMNPGASCTTIFKDQNERLDFRRSNLENQTYKTRSVKQIKRTTPTTSVYRGVSLISKTKKWNAQICVNQHSMSLGTYESEIEAALAYNRAAKLYFGDDGYQNDVESKKPQKSK